MYTSANASQSSRSSADQKAFVLAEDGVNDALAVLSNPSNNALSGTALLCSTGAPLPCDVAHARVTTYDGGLTKWWGNIDPNTSTWTISSWGIVHNPSAPSPMMPSAVEASRRRMRPSRSARSCCTFRTCVTSRPMTEALADLRSGRLQGAAVLVP